MSCSLSIATWKTIDRTTACVRMSFSEKGGYNIGALRVCNDIFEMIKNENERAQFFLNCESLGLHGSRLFRAYEDFCKSDYEKFIQCVLRSDYVMMNYLRQKEEK